VGTVETTVHAQLDGAGNSEMGNLLTDAQREATAADIVFTTPSWVRGDINPGPATWGELFRVQPFGNRLVKVWLTGKQIVELLNQQWTFEDHPRILHVSGLSYTWDAAKDAKNRVLQVQHAGRPIVPERKYTVVMNEYLAEGGDAFTVLQSAPHSPTALLDIDALESYVKKHSPIRPNLEKRIERLH
jgi:5'-nucleotidase